MAKVGIIKIAVWVFAAVTVAVTSVSPANAVPSPGADSSASIDRANPALISQLERTAGRSAKTAGGW